MGKRDITDFWRLRSDVGERGWVKVVYRVQTFFDSRVSLRGKRSQWEAVNIELTCIGWLNVGASEGGEMGDEVVARSISLED